MIPHWITAEREASMQVDDRIRECVAFVGPITGNGGFVADGTGFFAYTQDDEFDFRYFVTAAHLIRPARKQYQIPNGDIGIRINTVSGGFRVIKTKFDDWIFPNDTTVDICVYPFDDAIHNSERLLKFSQLSLDTIALNTPDQFEWSGISIGDEVFIAGLFVGRIGEKKNIPIIRIGNIAAMPEEPIEFASPRNPAYLIETRSLGGTSGSPVFLNLRSQRSGGKVEHGRKVLSLSDDDQKREKFWFTYFLIGMIIWTHGGNYQSEFIKLEDSNGISVAKDADFNAGISVALPIRLLIDLLYTKPMINTRAAAVESKRKKSGARPASAGVVSLPSVSPSTPDGETNPSHREDFSRLLNAAAQSQKRDEQT